MGAYALAETTIVVDGRGSNKFIVPEQHRELAKDLLAVLDLGIVKEWAAGLHPWQLAGTTCSSGRCPLACALLDCFSEDVDAISVTDELIHVYPKGWNEGLAFTDFAIRLPDVLAEFVRRVDTQRMPLAELTAGEVLQLVDSFRHE